MHQLDRLALRTPLATVALLTFLAAPLYLGALGEPLLWQDEGTTSILGRHVAATGLPIVGYGAGAGTQDFDAMRSRWDLNVDSPWLHDYLAAVAWWVMPEPPDSMTAARQLTRLLRLPFAVIALLLPLATYALVRAGASAADSTRGARVALLAAALTATSPLLVLHARQVRYYAPAALFTVLVLYAYLRARRAPSAQRRTADVALAMASTLLVATNDVVWIAVTAALVAHWTLFGRRDLSPRRAFAALAVPGAVATAWFLLVATADKYGRVALAGVLDNAFAYAVELNAHALPVAVLAVGALLHRRRIGELLRGGASAWSERLDFVSLLALTIAAVVGIHLVIDIVFLRYLVAAVPLCAVVVAMLLVPPEGQRSAIGLGWIMLLPLLLTDVAGWVSDAPMRHGLSQRAARRHQHWIAPHTLWELSTRLRHLPAGPVTAVLEVLYREGDASQSMVATYGDQPLSVLTPVAVYGGFSGQYPPAGTTPEWIWLRASTTAEMEGKRGAAAAWIAANVDMTAYACRRLAVPDRQWEWRPDPDVFWTLGVASPFYWVRDDSVPSVRLCRLQR